MAFTMAPATESVMGSLPRAKAGVGSAVNDTTRQVGGALGVAIIGSLVASVYSSRVADLGARFGLSGSALAEARGSLGAALEQSGSLDTGGAAFARGASDAFVRGLSEGLRVASLIVLFAAVVAYRFLPARAHDHVEVGAGEAVFDDGAITSAAPVAGS
jgi:hypothetical protein